jgi:hypothetical protein
VAMAGDELMMLRHWLNRYRYCDGNRNRCSNSAKITLVKGDLQGIVKAKELSHAVMKNINQNLFCFLYNVLGIPIAAGFYILFWSFTFTDDCWQ